MRKIIPRLKHDTKHGKRNLSNNFLKRNKIQQIGISKIIVIRLKTKL